MIDNFINGNLKEAKQQARSFSQKSIYACLRTIGYSVAKANLSAFYLKNPSQSAFQAACNAN